MFIEENGVDVTFEMIYRNERKVVGEGQRLSVGDADQKRAGKTRTRRDGDSVEIGKREVRFGQSCADDGHDGAEVLAACKLWNDAAIASVRSDL